MFLNKIKNFARRYLMTRASYKFFLKDLMPLTDLEKGAAVLETMRFGRKLEPVLMDRPLGRRLLFISPHPDDEVLGPGGTLIRSLAQGCEVCVVYLALGREGRSQTTLRDEALSVAQEFGFEARFLNFSNGQIPVDGAGLKEFSSLVGAFRPDTVFTPFFLDDHDDHRRASEIILRAHEAGLLDCNFEVWGYQVYTALPGNVIVDISDVREEKEKAIRMYRSEAKVRDWAHWALGLNAFNSRYLGRVSEPRYVEAFFVLPGADYLNLCAMYFGQDSSRCYYSTAYQSSD